MKGVMTTLINGLLAQESFNFFFSLGGLVGAYHLLWFVEEAGGIKDCGENASNEVVDMLDILLLSLISADIFYF